SGLQSCGPAFGQRLPPMMHWPPAATQAAGPLLLPEQPANRSTNSATVVFITPSSTILPFVSARIPVRCNTGLGGRYQEPCGRDEKYNGETRKRDGRQIPLSAVSQHKDKSRRERCASAHQQEGQACGQKSSAKPGRHEDERCDPRTRRREEPLTDHDVSR